MTKPNPANARVKRQYFEFLTNARGRDEATIDGVAKSLARFETYTQATDFKRFHRAQAMAFKTNLAAALNARTGERLSKATMLGTLRDLREFFRWLAREPGYRTHVQFADADYFNLAAKDEAVARARREPNPPTLDQIRAVLAAMPTVNVWDRRDRALVAFASITGARAAALASFRLGHVNVEQRYVDQDARTVRTKGSKSFRTAFIPFLDVALPIVADWTRELTIDHLRGPRDALFPATQIGVSATGGFAPIGVKRTGWASSEGVRDAFRKGFAAAGLPYYKPHSLRTMLTRHAMTLDLTPEEMKAFSQNLGHSDVLTTLGSYGSVPTHRQSELIHVLGERRSTGGSDDDLAEMEALVASMKAKRSRPH